MTSKVRQAALRNRTDDAPDWLTASFCDVPRWWYRPLHDEDGFDKSACECYPCDDCRPVLVQRRMPVLASLWAALPMISVGWYPGDPAAREALGAWARRQDPPVDWMAVPVSLGGQMERRRWQYGGETREAIWNEPLMIFSTASVTNLVVKRYQRANDGHSPSTEQGEWPTFSPAGAVALAGLVLADAARAPSVSAGWSNADPLAALVGAADHEPDMTERTLDPEADWSTDEVVESDPKFDLGWGHTREQVDAAKAAAPTGLSTLARGMWVKNYLTGHGSTGQVFVKPTVAQPVPSVDPLVSPPETEENGPVTDRAIVLVAVEQPEEV